MSKAMMPTEPIVRINIIPA